MKEIKEKLRVVILCAGEGTRIREINSNLPKSMIQIQSMDNKPILNIIIDDLLSQGLNNIIIILGFMGKVIESYISSLKNQNPILYNKIITLNAHPEYKKGPLFTFLTILGYPKISKKENNFLVFPGDTVFDQALLNDVMMILMKEIEKFQEKPIIFYKRVKASDINKKTHLISRVKTIKKRNIEILTQIEEIETSNISEKTYIDQIIPIFFLNYEFLLLISQILKSSHSNKISDILNEVCNRNLQDIVACEITSKGSFYDIDTIFDLDHLNKKKSGQ
ncbi:MAG: sugar phosphate nucleotidyltransferase [Promethearchaeota archaeon]